MKRSDSNSWIENAGSLVLPVILLLSGLILIGGDRVGLLSLDRIQNLWPFALILVGLSELLINSDQPPAGYSALRRSARSQNGAGRV